MIIDTHVHIYDEAFDEDFAEVVTRAKNAGVVKMVMPGIDSSYHERMMACARKLDGYAVPAIGLHPTSIDGNWEKELRFVEDHIPDYPFCAIGEIGMDCHWSKDYLQEQKEVFYAQILLADRYGLPVIIHCRDAMGETLEILERAGKVCSKQIRGVFHAYSGSLESYREIQKLGDFKIGIGGVLTYKKAGIAEVIKSIPLEKIILETDAPWLAPVPHRGKRNESSYLTGVIGKIGELTGTDTGEIERITTQNATSLFNIIL